MFKKHFFYAALLALGLTTAACSNEIDAPTPEDESTVTFTAQLPANALSRAADDYGKGTSADMLRYAVYETGTKNVIFTSENAKHPTATFDANNLTFTLKLNLVKGITCDCIFWAQNSQTDAYKLNLAQQTIEINYKGADGSDGIDGNDEARDAFFNRIIGLSVKGTMQKPIELRRPFAQLNICTRGYEAAQQSGIFHKTTTVTVDDVATSLNLMDGIADASEGKTTTVTFKAHEILESTPIEHENADGSTTQYHYLSMNYILTGSQDDPEADESNFMHKKQKENKDVTIVLHDKNGKKINTFKVSALPLQRHYRTNIYGPLLTPGADYDIELDPGLADDPNNPQNK